MSAPAQAAASKPRLIVVVGTTGVGKTRLGVDLCQQLAPGGEVVSVDSMQVYDKLDIVSAKVTQEEAQGVPHHLLSMLPVTCAYDANRFAHDAAACVQRIGARGKVPVLVGGTFLYVEALLFESLMSGERREAKELPEELAGLSAEEMHAHLQEIDPEMAGRLHPNDERRVRRSVAVFYERGKRHSEFVKDDEELRESRYDCLVLWLHASRKEQLHRRLDSRVDRMFADGLVREVAEVQADVEKGCADEQVEYGCGVCGADVGTCGTGRSGAMQAIGFKEVLPLLEGEISEEEARERVQLATRQYAQQQVKWLRSRMKRTVTGLQKQNVQIVRIDTTPNDDEVVWEEQVLAPALQLARAFLHADDDFGAALEQVVAGLPNVERLVGGKAKPKDKGGKHTCTACNNRDFYGDNAWSEHLASRKHRKRVASLKRRGIVL